MCSQDGENVAWICVAGRHVFDLSTHSDRCPGSFHTLRHVFTGIQLRLFMLQGRCVLLSTRWLPPGGRACLRKDLLHGFGA